MNCLGLSNTLNFSTGQPNPPNLNWPLVRLRGMGFDMIGFSGACSSSRLTCRLTQQAASRAMANAGSAMSSDCAPAPWWPHPPIRRWLKPLTRPSSRRRHLRRLKTSLMRQQPWSRSVNRSAAHHLPNLPLKLTRRENVRFSPKGMPTICPSAGHSAGNAVG